MLIYNRGLPKDPWGMEGGRDDLEAPKIATGVYFLV